MKNKKIIVLTGPTAVGKSDIAVLLAKKINAEIISADSSQVYRGFDIGSGKITLNEKQNIPHHMLDILNFNEDFNVALFKNFALTHISEILKTGKNVIICGGTGLYIKALVEGLKFFNVPKNEELRAELNRYEVTKLHKILSEIDAESSKNIDKNNKVRLIRAIEIANSNKAKLAFEKPEYSYLTFVLNLDRKTLYNKINLRVEKMFDSGLENEVRSLMDIGANLTHNAFKSIGYKELYNYILTGEGSLEDVKEKIKQTTRKYAKRQLTWFRKIENTIWLNAEDKNEAVNEILKIISDNQAL